MTLPERHLALFNKFVHKYGRLPTEVDPEYLEMLRMSKYRILDVPDVQPGKCSNCGASKNDGRKYIDFGLHVDWYGAVYLCGECLHDIANAVGLFKKLETSLLAAELKAENVGDLREKGVELHERVTQLVKELEEFYANVHSVGNNSSPDGSSNVGTSQTADESGTSKTKSRTSKSTPSAGSKDIRSLADLLDDPRN